MTQIELATVRVEQHRARLANATSQAARDHFARMLATAESDLAKLTAN
jgi:hypothetical protein